MDTVMEDLEKTVNEFWLPRKARILRTSHKRSSTPKGEEADAAIGCSMASTVFPHCPSSRLPHPPKQEAPGEGAISKRNLKTKRNVKKYR